MPDVCCWNFEAESILNRYVYMVEQFSCSKCLYMFIVLFVIVCILQHSSGGIICIGCHRLLEQTTIVFCVVQSI